MVSFEHLAGQLSDVVARTGPFAPAVLVGASFVEYVFPPFPGDTIVLLGAWYAVHGALSWPAAFAAVTAGAVAGAWLDWEVGRALAPALERGAGGRLLDRERLLRFDLSYRRWGGWLLVLNRFLPGIRAFLFVAAGAAHLPRGRVLLLGGLSAALWNALLLGVGAFLARNVAEMAQLMERYTNGAWVVMGIALALFLARAWWRRRR